MQRAHLQPPDRRKGELPASGNSHPQILQWLQNAAAAKHCLENPDRCTTGYLLRVWAIFIYLFIFSKTLLMHCLGSKVHFARQCSLTLWLTLSNSTSHKSSFVFVITSEEDQPKVSSIHQPVRTWDPQQRLQLYTAFYFGFFPFFWAKVRPPQSCRSQPWVYWIVLTLTHTV